MDRVRLRSHKRGTGAVPASSDARSEFSDSESCWFPRASVVFNVLLSARITAAFLSNISDCDETYNYWEPAHFLIYGSGFQTWEYSPKYAIRSYGYILFHVLPATFIKNLFRANKVTVFYYVRFLLAILCAACETYFYKSVVSQFGGHVGRLLFVFLALASGMFVAATAFLPSSFAMYTLLIAYGGWLSRNQPIAIFGIALGALVGWPFCAALGIPIAFDIVVRQRRMWIFLQWSVGIFLAIMIPLVAIDSHYYGKQVIAPLNIVMYNVFGQGGPDLYGVEPWSFYFVNGFLNFNIAFVMAVTSLPFCVAADYIIGRPISVFKLPMPLVLSPLYIWGIIFFTRPHKEERFLFPVYPCICLAAALVLNKVQVLYHWFLSRGKEQHYSAASNWLAGLTLFIFAAMSLSRSAALFTGYHAPLELYPELHNLVTPYNPEVKPMFSEDQKVFVCVGKEWYRFPSSFFLPDKWELRFLKSEFRGQLPQPYSSGPDAMKIVPDHMNDMNREEPTRYTHVDDCDLLIDLAVPTESELEPDYSKMAKRWEVIATKRFLLASRSHPLLRAFYVPFLSARYTMFCDYNILRSKKKPRRKSRRLQSED